MAVARVLTPVAVTPELHAPAVPTQAAAVVAEPTQAVEAAVAAEPTQVEVAAVAEAVAAVRVAAAEAVDDKKIRWPIATCFFNALPACFPD